MPYQSGDARREYGRAWRAAHPGYFAAWRAAHRESERSRIRRWKAAHPDKVREQRRRYLERRRTAVEPLPAPYTGHPLFDAARAVLADLGLREHGGMAVWSDPTWHDVMGTMILAAIEGADMAAAARRAWSEERRWRTVHLPFLVDPSDTRDSVGGRRG